MPRMKEVGTRAPLPAEACAPVVPVDSLSAALASFAVWANSAGARSALMRDSEFPLEGDLPAFLVLNQLIYRGAARPTDIAEALELTTSHISKIISRLEVAGLVRRAPAPDDTRAVVVGLTDSGRAAARRVTSCADSMFQEIFADWDEKDREDFTRLIVKYAHGLDAVSAHDLSRVSGYAWSGGQSPTATAAP